MADRGISNKVRRAIGALLSGEAKTQKDAASIAGISEAHMSRLLKADKVKRFLTDEVKGRMTTIGLALASRVTETLIETAESEYVRADLAKHVMGIAGVKPERDDKTTNVGSVHLTVLMGDDRVTLAAADTRQVIDIKPQSETQPVAVLNSST